MQPAVHVTFFGLFCLAFGICLVVLLIGGAVALVSRSGAKSQNAPLWSALGLGIAFVIAIPLLGLVFVGSSVRMGAPMPAPPMQIQPQDARFEPEFGSSRDIRFTPQNRPFIVPPRVVVEPESFTSGPTSAGPAPTTVSEAEVSSSADSLVDGPISALTAIAGVRPSPEPADAPPADFAVVSSVEPSRPPSNLPTSLPVPTDDRTVRSSVSLPTWAVLQADQRAIPGEPFRQVVASQLFATESEARQDARRQVIEQVILDMRHGGWLRSPPSATFQPSQHTVDSVITQTHVETVSRDFGSFFAPMFRVWHLVEIGPSSRSMLLSELRIEQSESRNLVVLVAVGLIFCLPLAIVFQGWLSRRIPFGGRWLGIGAILILALFLIRWTRAQSSSTATISSSRPVTISIESPR